MQALPLGELYDALRAAGFAVGVDDHIRIGRLLARDFAWTRDTLRIAIGALVVTDPEERAAFDACWERWLRHTEAPRVPDLMPLPRAASRRKPTRWVLAVAAAIAMGVVAVLAIPGGDDDAPAQAPLDTAIDLGGTPPTVGSQVAPPPATDAIIDGPQAALALGAIVLAAAAVAGLFGARARRRFLPGPWRYTLAIPPATEPVLPRLAIEDAAASLTWQAHELGHDVDIARSVTATIRNGGFPTLVLRWPTRAPRFAVLQDTAGGADRWSFVYDELLRELVREGVELERYLFAASPELCTGADGRVVALGDLLDDADGVIAIGDGAAAVDPLSGDRAPWLGAMTEIPHRLWVNPLPPARWTAGAHAIAGYMPIEHGAAGAVAALRDGTARRGHPRTAYPAVIERAPGTASAVAALREALGERAFHLVAAVAVTGPPTIAAARWLAEAHALVLEEHDWLAVATLPWFRSEQWPVGLRERLRAALVADAPKLARAVALTSDRLFAASEPRLGSGAHLAWQLEGALRANERGDRAIATRALNQIARTPLAHDARGHLAALRLRDRGRTALFAAIAVGTMLVAGTVAVDWIGTWVAADAVASSVEPVIRESLAAGERLAPLAYDASDGEPIESNGPPDAESPADLARRDNADGEQLMSRGQAAEAAEKFTQASARVPAPQYFVNLCQARLDQGRLDAALAACTLASANSPSPDQRAAISRATEQINKMRRLASERARRPSNKPLDGAARLATVPATGGGSQAERALRLNEEGKRLMNEDRFAEAGKKFQEAVARVPEATYFVNLCLARWAEGQLDLALIACRGVEPNQPTPDQRARAAQLIERINEEAKRNNIKLGEASGGGIEVLGRDVATARPAPVPVTEGGKSQAEIAARLNEEGKELMYQDRFAEAATKFAQASARVTEAKYFLNLCTAHLQERKLNEALAACRAAETNRPSPDQQAKAAMLIERINQEASQNKRPPDEATHPATGQIYVNVGPMLASTGDPSVDARLGAVMVKVATKAIGKIRNMSIFQVGDTPAREILDAKGAMGFHVEGKVQELKVTKAGATTVSCKVQLSLTGYADKALLAVADGGASVQAAGSAPDIGLAGEDCVSASVEDLMAKHVIPAIPTRTAPKTQ